MDNQFQQFGQQPNSGFGGNNNQGRGGGGWRGGGQGGGRGRGRGGGYHGGHGGNQNNNQSFGRGQGGPNQNNQQQICPHLQKPGGCFKGPQKCNFFHPPDDNQNQQIQGGSIPGLMPQNMGGMPTQDQRQVINNMGNQHQQNQQHGPKPVANCRDFPNCTRGATCRFIHADGSGAQPKQHAATPGGQGQGPPIGSKVFSMCNELQNNGCCHRIRCKFIHIIPGTEMQETGQHVEFDKLKGSDNQLRLKINFQAQEYVVSQSIAKVNGGDALIAVTSQGQLHVVDTVNMKVLSQMQLKEQVHIVRAFEEVPDTIFVGYTQGQQHFIKIMTQSQEIMCSEVHGGPIVEIHVMMWNGQKVVFTSSTDQNIRAFTFQPDNSLQKVALHPTPQAAVTTFATISAHELLCGMNNGRLLKWDLNSNTQIEDVGHGPDSPITSLVKYQTFILSGDNLGKIQIRDMNQNFAMVEATTIGNYHLQAQNPPSMKVSSMIVIQMPPTMGPYIFTSSTGGLIYCIKPGTPALGFGASNDGIGPNHSKFPVNPNDSDITLLFKTQQDNKFCSFSRNGLLRTWVLNQVKLQQQPQGGKVIQQQQW